MAIIPLRVIKPTRCPGSSCSTTGIRPMFLEPRYFEKGMYREFGKFLKQNVDVPIILAGCMDNPEMAYEAFGTCCDIIAYGRPMLTSEL